jgi:2',3'-cyclic-nucleotide 2'-phosphodiesterase (5'-nucleotidase family)
LDTGDALIGGGQLGDHTRGEAVVAGMNLMGYDAMALGPKELSLGLEVLGERIAEAEFPMLSANAVLTSTGELVASPYAIVEVGDHKVGVIGLTRAPGGPLPGIQVLDPQQAAEQYVPEVAEQADTIVVLTNQTYRDGLDLAGAVPGIDLVVSALPDQLPVEAVRVPGTGTIVLSAEQPVARHTGRRVGRLLVAIGGDGTLSGESWETRPMDRQIVDDPEMGALLQKHLQ